jgi:drug/metabolite transporter (DMT)-like permease
MERSKVRWLAIIGITMLVVGILLGVWSPRAKPFTYLDEYEREVHGELAGWLFLLPLVGILLVVVSLVLFVKDVRTAP